MDHIGGTVAPLGVSWRVGLCFRSCLLWLDRTVSCFPPLSVRTVLSGAMEAKLQEQGFRVDLAPAVQSRVLSMQRL